MKHVNSASGFLFVGDPHISSRKPGRRKDKDFATTVLKKLEQAVRIANENNYVVVILGDLFNRPVEESESIKIRTIRVLKQAHHKVVYLLGNHERAHAKLSDDDSLSLIETSEAIDLIDTSGPYGTFDFDGVKFGLGGTPYGEEIPKDVSEFFEDCKSVVWITHHDLEFEGAYPNSMPTHEIKGCKLVVNGHMHLTKKIKKEGGTTWFNPGNITRQAVDAIDHKPRVWSLDNKGKITPYDLEVEQDIFDLTGHLVNSITYEDEGADKDQTMESVFVKLIEVSESSEMEETDDGSIIRELIEDKIEKMEAKDDVKSKVKGYVTGLLAEVADL